ncbi:MAG: hypothetical protein ABII81_00780 [Pseudomonadota bacterium]
MKKIVLSLAGVMAAAAFAPEASAIPAFARQTGMACSACHAQHFPVLNGFGRAFKAGGYTMMGAQEKVEGEHVSIPTALNQAILIKARYQKTNGSTADAVSGTTTNSGQWQVPDEFSLFVGGRVADSDTVKVGNLIEYDLTKNKVAGVRIPVVFDLDAAKLSAIVFATGQGPVSGYTESSNGVNSAMRWSEAGAGISAYIWSGLSKADATGVAFVAKNDMGYVNLSRFAPAFLMGGSAGRQLASTTLSLNVTPTVADFAVVAGVDLISGQNYEAAATTKVETKATAMNAQAHGEVGGMEAGFYATYVSIPATTTAMTNAYNANGFDKKGFTFGADFTVIPHALSVGAAYRNGKTGSTASETDNAITVSVIYDLFQNVALHAAYTQNSGTAYDAGGSLDKTATTSTGTSLLTLMLESAW